MTSAVIAEPGQHSYMARLSTPRDIFTVLGCRAYSPVRSWMTADGRRVELLRAVRSPKDAEAPASAMTGPVALVAWCGTELAPLPVDAVEAAFAALHGADTVMDVALLGEMLERAA